jgi:hypothetical protein
MDCNINILYKTGKNTVFYEATRFIWLKKSQPLRKRKAKVKTLGKLAEKV